MVCWNRIRWRPPQYGRVRGCTRPVLEIRMRGVRRRRCGWSALVYARYVRQSEASGITSKEAATCSGATCRRGFKRSFHASNGKSCGSNALLIDENPVKSWLKCFGQQQCRYFGHICNGEDRSADAKVIKAEKQHLHWVYLLLFTKVQIADDRKSPVQRGCDLGKWQ